jgi:hypothetical protein
MDVVEVGVVDTADEFFAATGALGMVAMGTGVGLCGEALSRCVPGVTVGAFGVVVADETTGAVVTALVAAGAAVAVAAALVVAATGEIVRAGVPFASTLAGYPFPAGDFVVAALVVGEVTVTAVAPRVVEGGVVIASTAGIFCVLCNCEACSIA